MDSEEEIKGRGNLGEAWTKIQDFISSISGSSSTVRVDTDTHDPVTEINENVYELYAPEDKDDINVEIIFFHGLQQGEPTHPHVNTWMTRGEREELWPRAWLGDSFPQARILSVSYDSSGTQGSYHGKLDLHLVAENFFSTLIRLAKVGQRWACPVVMVGHCLGGLVIKQMCVFMARNEFNLSSDRELAERFVENIRGVFLFATPQQGINFPPSITDSLRPSPLLESLTVLKKEISRLNRDFDHHRAKNKWVIHAVAESNQTRTTTNPMSFYHAVMVEEASARPNTDSFFTANAGHFDICKPVNKTNSAFQALVAFIEARIREETSTRQEPLRLPKHGGVGLESRIEEVKGRLQEHGKLAIVGMGGSGKTTLAKAVFNAMSHTFEYTCFVENVKDKLKQALGRTVDDLIMDNLHKGGMKMFAGVQSTGVRRILKQKVLLLVLDDVDTNEQIDLVLESGWLAKQSKVIATSRKQSKRLFPHEFSLYYAQLLNSTEACKLFCSHASNFGDISIELVKNIIDKCEGLPLTLEVIGTCLGSETREKIWEDALLKLSLAESLDGDAEGDDRLWGKLRVSFNTLGHMEQAMFLDCACFFAHYTIYLRYVKLAWARSWGAVDLAWQNLLDRCLVTEINHDDTIPTFKTIGMHEQLRDMGKSIARPQYPTRDIPITRIWMRDEVFKLLINDAQDQGQNVAIEGLNHIHRGESNEVPMVDIPSSRLRKMGRLRYLALRNVNVVGNGRAFPPNVGYLGFYGSRRSLPPIFFCFGRPQISALHESDIIHLGNLAVLDVWTNDEFKGNFLLPKNFGELRNLQVLRIGSIRLDVLPDSFCQLSSLQFLELFCPSLRCLPTLFGELTSLQNLVLLFQLKLSKLPTSFGQLTSLQEFYILHCPELLPTLPDCLATLPALREVQIGKEGSWEAEEGESLRFPDISQEIDLASSQLEGFGWLPSANIDAQKKHYETSQFSFVVRTFHRAKKVQNN